MLTTLRNRNFSLLWLAGLVSFTGDWLLITALPFYVYQQTGSALATAGLTIASLVPSLLLVQFNVPIVSIALITAFLIGPEQIAAGAALQTLLQRSVRDTYKGRIFGALGTTGAVLSLLGGGLGGVLGTVLGVVPTLNLAAGLTIASGMLAWALLPKQL